MLNSALLLAALMTAMPAVAEIKADALPARTIPNAKNITPPGVEVTEQFFDTGWLTLSNLGEPKMTEKLVSPGRITNVNEAQIRYFFPHGWTVGDKRGALIIFPGGGYSLEAIDKEGINIALWAAQRGMVGIVVKYRVSDRNPQVGLYPGPLLDARQGVRVTRHFADKLGIDPKKIGIIGFSAGGHLAGMTATQWDKKLPEEEKNPLKAVSARPDFAMFIYPVLSMEQKETHSGTRFKILGAKPTQEQIDLCSAEKQVTKDTPPVFLVQSKDDFVSCKNSLLMEQACKEKGVPVELNLYEKGGHGYGMEQRGNPTDVWPAAAEKWLKSQGVMGN